MAEVKPLTPAQLLIDHENPRIVNDIQAENQRDALNSIARGQQEKLLVLAEDIVEQRSLNPAELMLVVPSKSEPDRYIVREGNRRLTAIRALENPDIFVGALEPPVLQRFRTLSSKYQQSPIREILCCVMPTSDATIHWLDLLHTGPNSGAGTVQWGADEKARFRFRSRGEIGLHTRLLDFLEDGEHLTRLERQRVPTTSFERLIKSPDVKAKLGITIGRDGVIHFQDEAAAITGLLFMIRDLSSGRTRIPDIYTKEQRSNYAANIPVNITPTPKVSGAGGVPASIPLPSLKPVPQIPLSRPKPERDRMIPWDCPLRIADHRIRRIAKELMSLSLREYTNAVAVLFRVFIELSVDFYRINTMSRPALSVKERLSDKLKDVVGHLEGLGKLSRQEGNPIRAACAKNSFLATSVLTMNEYVHSPHMVPSPSDLRAAWDGFQPFIRKLWPR
jgi:hypothetical protein